ncbi:EthD domain-domain-containing protein [Clohesyomyces aquaticus]|uniref:EthD domain-domain-containing protein n=1 Tax=Clohesyomyces aquaticus TaxID=1231657 RepID=A0A1Y1Y815_9PLEO|nr:EthD domain-domain-containing protein [Clohesyomyces aquaticus]
MQTRAMTFSFLLFITRKPTISPEEFKTYWDTKHVELLKSIAGDNFPLTHTRHYIARPAETNGSWPAAILIGSQDDFTYDGIAELVFPDESAFQTFFGIVSAPEAAAKIAADEETFIVREKMKAVVMGETSVTSRN